MMFPHRPKAHLEKNELNLRDNLTWESVFDMEMCRVREQKVVLAQILDAGLERVFSPLYTHEAGTTLP